MRDQLLTVLLARVQRAADAGDPAEVRTEEALAEAEALLPHLLVPDGTGVALDVAHAVGLYHWLRAAWPEDDSTRASDEQSALILLRPVALAMPAALPELVLTSLTTAYESEPDDGESAIARAVSNVGVLLLSRLVAGGDRRVAPAAIGLFRHVADNLPPDDPIRPVVLSNLGYALTFAEDPEIRRRKDILDAAKAPMLAALNGTDSDSPITAVWRMLGVDASDGDSRWAQAMDVLRTFMRYPGEVGWDEVLAKAQAYQERHLPEANPVAAPSDLSGLAEVGELVDLLVRELPGDHPQRAMVDSAHVLVRLTKAFHLDGADATESINAMAMELDVGPAIWSRLHVTGDHLTASVALGHALLSPAEMYAVTERAVRGYRATESPDLPTKTHLAHALFAWYQLTGEQPAFEEAAGLARQVVAATSPPDPGLVVAWTGAVTHRINLRGGHGDHATEAIARRNATDALEALEEWRATALSAALNTRRELAALRTADPELADRFIAVREEVYADLNPGHEPRPSGGWANPTAVQREWSDVHDRITALPGFDRFLLPVPLSANDVLPAAADGPVVIVNVNASRCDAVTLMSDGVGLVALPELNAAELAMRVEAFRSVVEDVSAPAAQPVLLDTLGWLWDVLAAPVLDALGYTGPPPAGEPLPRVWWSPTGALNFLPLHAAGRQGGSVLDRVVSSYTPTLRALLYSRSRLSAARHTVLSVAMPDTPGYAPLPATVHEAAALAGSGQLVGATRADVLSALPNATIAHFACHANSDPSTVSDSHLMLRDGPLTIAEIGQLRLDTAELAYLSACATARGNAAFANEALHMASAFQLAGYSQAVGTLWPVSDSIAARTAKQFYRRLADAIRSADRLPAAVALHEVTRGLRDTAPDQPWSWAGYVHSGA